MSTTNWWSALEQLTEDPTCLNWSSYFGGPDMCHGGGHGPLLATALSNRINKMITWNTTIKIPQQNTETLKNVANISDVVAMVVPQTKHVLNLQRLPNIINIPKLFLIWQFKRIWLQISCSVLSKDGIIKCCLNANCHIVNYLSFFNMSTSFHFMIPSVTPYSQAKRLFLERNIKKKAMPHRDQRKPISSLITKLWEKIC